VVLGLVHQAIQAEEGLQIAEAFFVVGGRRAGQPRLSVDRTQIDFGKQPVSRPVKATFVLTNNEAGNPG
jgi:hypothetical protein